MVGPNRFLRHFTGDVDAAGKHAQVEADYYVHGHSSKPKLALKLTNTGSETVTFTVTSDHYSKDRAASYHVRPHSDADPHGRPAGQERRLVRRDP